MSARRNNDVAWLLRMGRHGVQVLTIVLVLALVFTMVNVQQFAAGSNPVRSFEWWISWLLDPMASLTMAAAIVYEGVLADYGLPKVGWLTATKWYAGIATWSMNIWSPLVHAIPSGVLLHSVAPGIVLGLAEAAPHVRRHIADKIAELTQVVEQAAARPMVGPEPVAVYPRVGPSSWSAPSTPAWASTVAPAVPEPEPAPLPELVIDHKPEPVIDAGAPPAPAVKPAPAPDPVPLTLEPSDPVGELPADSSTGQLEPGPLPDPQSDQAGERLSGAALDAAIAAIFDEHGLLGRPRVAALVPGPRPSDHALKQSIARVKASRELVLNGSHARAGSSKGPAGGGSDV